MDDEIFFSKIDGIKARLYRIAYGYLGSEAAAVEAVDEAIFNAYRAKNKLRQPAFFDTWVTRILLNECSKEKRRRKRELPAETLPETAAESFDALPLKEAVAKLPEQMRQVILLRYFAGLTVTETAEALDIPQGTAATRQRRALTLLKLELEEASI